MAYEKDMRDLQFATYGEIFNKFRTLSERYGGLPIDNLVSAFTKASGGRYAINNPYIQNRRVKQISSLPVQYTKDQVADMITNPDGNETQLRQVDHALEYTAYPLFHMRKIYQDMLTYHNYIVPRFTAPEDMSDEFKREWILLEKFRKELNPAVYAHEIVGQVLQEGKVFYYPRFRVDKSHNKVDHAFMQQLPSDWTKIVGFNNKSKYTVAFNMFYFLQPGTDPLQFGKLFIPYMDDFYSSLGSEPAGVGKTVVFAQDQGIDLEKFSKLQEKGPMAGDPDVYYQNGRWFYWVTLPVNKIFTFEADDVNRNAVSPFTGLFLSMIQIAQYEQIQLELVQNPLISLLTGEIPYRDDKDATTSDPYKLSNAGRKLFEALWYQMLAETNTSGVGLYMAPLENMTMHQLAEAPSATQISTNGYGYAMAKAGVSAIIPTTTDPRVGISQISLQLESKFARCVYAAFENMMQCIFEQLNLKYEWSFVMFGDVATDKDAEEGLKKDMTLGILPATVRYLALHDMSLLEDICISNAIQKSGILDLRIPLISTFSAKSTNTELPPQAKHDMNPGGRPKSEVPETEGQESDVDRLGE